MIFIDFEYRLGIPILKLEHRTCYTIHTNFKHTSFANVDGLLFAHPYYPAHWGT
jgi:hypothetical protein